MHLENKFISFLKKSGINNQRNLNISNHIVKSVIYKGGSVVANLLLIPLTLRFLDQTNFGIWLTLSSILTWFSFFDIGLGNGLRYKFAEARANKDLELAKAYVSSAYFTIGIIGFLLIFTFSVFNLFINWSTIFNTDQAALKDLRMLMLIVMSFFGLQLIMKLILSIYLADQQHSAADRINFYSQVTSLLIVWLLAQNFESSLIFFGCLVSAVPVLILLIFNVTAFSGRYKDYRPSLAYWKFEHTKDIFGLGLKFLIIQISALILYSTDNIIISQLFGPASVVPFNIAQKYFGITSMFFSILISPYWSSITDAYVKGDFLWIESSMRRLLKLIIPFLIIILLMIWSADLIYYYWMGKMITVPLFLSVLMGIYSIMGIFCTLFTYFISGTGKIKVQLVQGVVVALLNIPISILFAKYFGIPGVLLGTIVCMLPNCILAPLQYYKIINNKALGIWGK